MAHRYLRHGRTPWIVRAHLHRVAHCFLANIDFHYAATTTTTVTGVSLYLLKVTKALDLLPDRTRVMSTMSGILVALGSIPEIDAVKDGAMGEFLASETARTAGAVAKGVGHWMKGQVERDARAISA